MPFFYSFVAQYILNGNFNSPFAGHRFVVRFIRSVRMQWTESSSHPVFSGRENRHISCHISGIYAFNWLAGRK